VHFVACMYIVHQVPQIVVGLEGPRV